MPRYLCRRPSGHQRVLARAIAYTFTVAMLLLPYGAPDARATDLDATERRLVEAVDANNADATAFLERVVNINSGTLNLEGVREVGRVFAEQFDALGFRTRWVDGEAFDRAGHLFAERGSKGPHLLIIGHLDTVFEPDSPFQKYEPQSQHIVRGPGIVDMKGGNVIALYALKALADAGVLDDLTVTVAFIGDEEKVGEPVELARASLVEAAEKADVAIALENGDNDAATAVVARRGSSSWTLRVTGKPAHSSQIFRDDIGSGAIYEAARIVNAFYEELRGEQYLTFNPGIILGATDVEFELEKSRGSAFGKNNVIAEHTIVSGDLRTISIEQRERAKEKMLAIIAENRPHTSAEIEFIDRYPPLEPSDGNLRLLAIFDQLSRDLGFGEVTAVDPLRAGAADVAFTSGLVEMAIDGVGLLGDGDHTVGELADMRTLPMQTKRVAVLLYRLSRAEGLWQSD